MFGNYLQKNYEFIAQRRDSSTFGRAQGAVCRLAPTSAKDLQGFFGSEKVNLNFVCVILSVKRVRFIVQ